MGESAGTRVGSAAQFGKHVVGRAAMRAGQQIVQDPSKLNKAISTGVQGANVAINEGYLNIGMSNQRVGRSNALANPWEWQGPTAPGRVIGTPELSAGEPQMPKNYVPEGSDFMEGNVPNEHHWATRAIPTETPEAYKAENFMSGGELQFNYNARNLGDWQFS